MTPAVHDKLFLDVEEAAARLGVSIGWIYARTRERRIPHHRMGKLVRFNDDDLRQIESAGRVEAQ